jgi:hypothetical protein
MIRSVGHPVRELTVLPASLLHSHQIVIRATGTGNTAPLLLLTRHISKCCNFQAVNLMAD